MNHSILQKLILTGDPHLLPPKFEKSVRTHLFGKVGTNSIPLIGIRKNPQTIAELTFVQRYTPRETLKVGTCGGRMRFSCYSISFLIFKFLEFSFQSKKRMLNQPGFIHEPPL